MSLVTVYIRRIFGCLVWVCFIAKKKPDQSDSQAKISNDRQLVTNACCRHKVFAENLQPFLEIPQETAMIPWRQPSQLNHATAGFNTRKA